MRTLILAEYDYGQLAHGWFMVRGSFVCLWQPQFVVWVLRDR